MAASELLTKQELEKRLGISPRTLDNWLEWKIIPCIRVRNVIRFNWERVVHVLNTTCEVPANETSPALPRRDGRTRETALRREAAKRQAKSTELQEASAL